jgi:hypothetical protein
VLDVACGPDKLALRLVNHAAQVHDIEFSEAMLVVFRNKIEQAGYRSTAAMRKPCPMSLRRRLLTVRLMFFPDRLLAFPTGSTGEFWDFMVKGSAPIQMMKKGLGEALWREKEKLALAWLEETPPTLKRPLTSDVWLGVAVK